MHLYQVEGMINQGAKYIEKMKEMIKSTDIILNEIPYEKYENLSEELKKLF